MADSLPKRSDYDQWIGPLREFVKYEKENGKIQTVMKYRPLSDAAMSMNFDIPSQYGLVDVDWMCCVAWAAYFKPIGYAAFYALKEAWNITDPRGGFDWSSPMASLKRRFYNKASFTNEANRNAPKVANIWIGGDQTLEHIFAPALHLNYAAGVCE